MAQRTDNTSKRLLRDIDGCTANFFAVCIKEWGEPQIAGAYSLEEAYPMISSREINTFINLPSTYTHMHPINGAVKADAILRDSGWEIVNVTCRPVSVMPETFIWLWDNLLAPYEQDIPALFVSRKQKIDMVRRQSFTAVVEDNHEIARAMSQAHPNVYLFDWLFNQGPRGSAVRVFEPHWENMLQKLLKE